MDTATRGPDSGVAESEPAPGGTPTQASQALKVLVGTAVVAVALNLRSGSTSLGAVLGEVSRAWHLSGLQTGILTALPIGTFAVVGAATPTMARWFRAEPVLACAMLVAGFGLLLRATSASVGGFAAASVLALAGAAIGNVLLPPLIKRYFPDRVGTMTALYSTALALGMTGGAALTEPAERAFGGDWRIGLGMWTDLAAFAALPCLALCWRHAGTARTPEEIRREPKFPVHRSPLARWLALFFGCQALNAYVVIGWLPSILAGAGIDARAASLPLALPGAISIPMSLLVPALAVRQRWQPGLVVLTTGCYAIGYLGLLCAAGTFPWLWAALLGAGNGAFALSVTLIGLRSGRSELTAPLSGMVQSSGYLIAMLGPLLFGLLHQLSGGWRVPLLVVLATLAGQLLSGWRAAAPGTVEADLTTTG